MAEALFCLDRKLCDGLAVSRHKEDRIIAKPPIPSRSLRDSSCPDPAGDCDDLTGSHERE